jgi:hypothetical protein
MKGPQKATIDLQVCNHCESFKSRFLISGRNPEYTYICLEIDEPIFEVFQDKGRIIGTMTSGYCPVPCWCPFLNEEKNAQQK